MIIEKMLYSRKFFLGNYETESITLEATLEDEDDVKQKYRVLKTLVLELQQQNVWNEVKGEKRR